MCARARVCVRQRLKPHTAVRSIIHPSSLLFFLTFHRFSLLFFHLSSQFSLFSLSFNSVHFWPSSSRQEPDMRACACARAPVGKWLFVCLFPCLYFLAFKCVLNSIMCVDFHCFSLETVLTNWTNIFLFIVLVLFRSQLRHVSKNMGVWTFILCSITSVHILR